MVQIRKTIEEEADFGPLQVAVTKKRLKPGFFIFFSAKRDCLVWSLCYEKKKCYIRDLKIFCYRIVADLVIVKDLSL